ncbi:MAG: TIGR03790 family protein [Phycisphaeraceae bacterium]|nr:TIGR03790 family protein [Phycisphaeraceae bacterium]
MPRLSRAAGAMMLLAGSVLTPAASGGGSPEKTLLIIDPSDPTSLYVGNYYKHARGIPDSNVLYMYPGATNYQAFVTENLAALHGTLEHNGLDDHIDIVVVMPGSPFAVNAPGLIGDGCSPVNRFSISGAYSSAFVSDEILGGLGITYGNRYARNSIEARGFSSQTSWLSGSPSTSPNARRYYLGAMLGYTGERGNTVNDLLAMIDRSVAADGTFPSGTFYFMETTDAARSDPRDGMFDAAITDLTGLGGTGQHLQAILPPDGTADCLGIMTGIATPGVDQADITILPGAICDHLTSFAATFDNGSQEKLSRWIANGASGSWGAVEEPCNYFQKFPVPRAHIGYFQGLSLGEALFRSGLFFPFQMLLYGDPLTRPFTHIPDVTLTNLPADPVDETALILLYLASTTHPNATVPRVDLFVDGRLKATAFSGTPFVLLPQTLADGWHELRVLGTDSTLVASAGGSLEALVVDIDGASATVVPHLTTGNLGTAFTFEVTVEGPGIVETRLVQNGRVLGAAWDCDPVFTVYGATLGAGTTCVQAEALMGDGTLVRSSPVELTIGNGGVGPTIVPMGVDYHKRVLVNQPILVELPALAGDSPDGLSFTIVQGPGNGTLVGGGTRGYRILKPNAGATGKDTIVYRVTGAGGTSQDATITVLYENYPLDRDADGKVTRADLMDLLVHPADVNLDGTFDSEDFMFMLDVLGCGTSIITPNARR